MRSSQEWAEPAEVVPFARQLPPEVSVVLATPAMYLCSLMPGEAELVDFAIERRQREFRAGRTAAREALRLQGCTQPQPILWAGHRAPAWPEGFAGSITHCEGLVCAVAVRKHRILSLGIDAESASPLEPELLRLVCRAEELVMHERLRLPEGSDWGKVAFCAKEAFFKCLYPLTRELLDFTDVVIGITVSPDGTSGTCRVDSVYGGSPVQLPEMEGRWTVGGGRVFASAVAAAA